MKAVLNFGQVIAMKKFQNQLMDVTMPMPGDVSVNVKAREKNGDRQGSAVELLHGWLFEVEYGTCQAYGYLPKSRL